MKVFLTAVLLLGSIFSLAEESHNSGLRSANKLKNGSRPIISVDQSDETKVLKDLADEFAKHLEQAIAAEEAQSKIDEARNENLEAFLKELRKPERPTVVVDEQHLGFALDSTLLELQAHEFCRTNGKEKDGIGKHLGRLFAKFNQEAKHFQSKLNTVHGNIITVASPPPPPRAPIFGGISEQDWMDREIDRLNTKLKSLRWALWNASRILSSCVVKPTSSDPNDQLLYAIAEEYKKQTLTFRSMRISPNQEHMAFFLPDEMFP